MIVCPSDCSNVPYIRLGIDESTKEIVAVKLTEGRVHDSQQLPSLLGQIPDPIGQVSGDGAYDTQTCYEAVLQRGPVPTFVPRRTDARRVGCSVGARGRVSPNTMFRFKALCGERLWARGLATQGMEARIKCAVLNRMMRLGMPETVRKG